MFWDAMFDTMPGTSKNPPPFLQFVRVEQHGKKSTKIPEHRCAG